MAHGTLFGTYRMKISLICAMSENRAIGLNNQLPWHLPADLKHFKELTMGKPIVMGRKTFESIGKALPGRKNIILTRNPDFQAENVEVLHSVSHILEQYSNEAELCIIGGAEIYTLFLPHATHLFLTIVHTKIEGDAYFPEFSEKLWRLEKQDDFSADEKNQFSYSFMNYKKI